MSAGKEELHNFRLSQKRFIVYQPSKARHEEHAGDSPQPSSPREPAESLPGRLLHNVLLTVCGIGASCQGLGLSVQTTICSAHLLCLPEQT